MLRALAFCFWLTFALPMAWTDHVADCNQDQGNGPFTTAVAMAC